MDERERELLGPTIVVPSLGATAASLSQAYWYSRNVEQIIGG